MPDNIQRNRTIARNTLFLYMRMVIVLLISLYTTRVIINALGVVDFGINNVVAGFVSMFAFLNASMSNGVQRFYNYKLGKEGEEALKKVYNTSLQIQGLIAIIVVLLLETFGLWYFNNHMVIPIERREVAWWVFQFSVLSLVIVIIQIPFSAAIMSHEKMDYFAYVSILDVLLKLGFALCISYVKTDKLFFYGCYGLGIAVLNFLLFYVYCKLRFKSIRFEYSFQKDLFKEMLSFSGWNIFGTFAYVMKGQGVNMLLNSFFGPVVNAARGVSSMIENAIRGFQSNIVVSFRPQTVQSYAQGNNMRVKNLMYSLSKLSYIMLFMVSMPVILELESILKLWLGETIPDQTISFTILTLIIMVLSGLNTPLSQVVHATGKMKIYQIGTSIVVCSILPFSWIALKMGGTPIVVYIVDLIMVIINQIVCLYLLKRIFPYSCLEYLKVVIWPCIYVTLISSIIPVTLHLIISQSIIRMIIVGVTSVGCTLLCSYYYALNNYEKELVLSFVQKIIKKK